MNYGVSLTCQRAVTYVDHWQLRMWGWCRWMEVWREPALRVLRWFLNRSLALLLHRYLPWVYLPLSTLSPSTLQLHIMSLSYLLRHWVVLSRHILYGSIVSEWLVEQLLSRLRLVNFHVVSSCGWELRVDLGIHFRNELGKRTLSLLSSLLKNMLFVWLDPLI